MCVEKSNTIFTKFPFSAIEKLSYIREKKCNLFWWYKKNHIPVQFFLERPSFENIWRKYHISMYFLRNSSFIFRLKSKIIFSGKRDSSFLMTQERSYSSTIFLERPSFQIIWKTKIWFFVQWFVKINNFPQQYNKPIYVMVRKLVCIKQNFVIILITT